MVVGLIENDRTTSSFLEGYLSVVEGTQVLKHVRSLHSLHATLLEGVRPDVLVVEHMMVPVTALKHVYTCWGNIPTLLIVHQKKDFCFSAYASAGVRGFYFSCFGWKEFPNALSALLRDGAYISPSLTPLLYSGKCGRIPAPAIKEMTEREKEVMDLACEGLSYREIADRLFITPFTVNKHLKNVYAKMKVRSKGELISRVKIHP